MPTQDNGTRPVKKINLALQGGGSHGAFTWGVLHEFLLNPSIEIEGLGGTSAGALNAVVYADGLARGGRQGAINALADFWGRVSEAALWSPFRRGPADIACGTWDIDMSPFVALAGLAGSLASPYQTNPFNHSPLRAALKATVDIEAIKAAPVKVFLSATDVETGRAKVFTREGMTLDMVLASACLPSMFQAIEIDGSTYWDGGFTGNPSLYPMIDDCESGDIAIVQINPLVRRGIPRTPTEIENRITELAFNSSLTAEMRAIATIDKLLAAGKISEGGPSPYRKIRIHRIHAEEEMTRLGVASKMNAEAPFLDYLHRLGRQTASTWISENGLSIGIRSTVDIASVYL